MVCANIAENDCGLMLLTWRQYKRFFFCLILLLCDTRDVMQKVSFESDDDVMRTPKPEKITAHRCYL